MSINFYEVVKANGESEMVNPKCVISFRENAEGHLVARMCDGSDVEYNAQAFLLMMESAEAQLYSLGREEAEEVEAEEGEVE